MRLLQIDPFEKKVTRFYHDCEIAIINFHVQAEELMQIPLGQENMLWLDLNWALRERQSFWTLKGNPDGVLGGYAVITGRDENNEIANCGLPDIGVLNQILWVTPEMASLNPVVQGLRREIKGYLPKQSFTYPEIVMITKANAERSDTVN